MFIKVGIVRVILLLTTLIAGFSSEALADNPPPQWLRDAAKSGVPTFNKDVPAVVMHNEQQVTLGTDGKLVTADKFAVKLLNNEGRHFAIARAFYLVSSGRVREIEAWLIRADGTYKNYEKNSILDIISDPDDVYNEGRLKIIDASREINSGQVFGYTVVSEDIPLFYQDTWSFQDRLPTLVSRYALNLPAGWKAASITFNHAEVKPQVNGSSYTWELRNLPPIPPELMSPAVVNLSPRIAVNYTPENAQAANKVFANWLDVSRWASALYDPEVIIDDNIAIKARELTANAKTELEKIQAIGRYVQNLQYISIDIGVGYGNGYRPRSSSLVLSRGYGDCKDKANLMRALLRVLKIDAYPIAIFSGDPTFVRETWASPTQFNHCIIAVKVSDSTISPTVINHAKLGRLLIFDATDSYTPVGDLPTHLQGSKALIIAGDNGGIATMPATPVDSDLLERKIEVTLNEFGAIAGTIRERANGQISSAFRRELRELSASDYRKAIESWLTRGATGARLLNVVSKDNHSEAGFDLDVDFSVPHYGQLMQNRLLVFKPVIVGRRNTISFTESKRLNPVELDSNTMKETVTFSLPKGFIVDEIPEDVNLETQFGKYSASFETKNEKLIFTRTMILDRGIIPADKYSSVRDFFQKFETLNSLPWCS